MSGMYRLAIAGAIKDRRYRRGRQRTWRYTLWAAYRMCLYITCGLYFQHKAPRFWQWMLGIKPYRVECKPVRGRE